MPHAGQSIKAIERIENASAQAITARVRLAQLETLLTSLALRGSLSEYNLTTATGDIAEVREILLSLQSELTKFRKGSP